MHKEIVLRTCNTKKMQRKYECLSAWRVNKKLYIMTIEYSILIKINELGKV